MARAVNTNVVQSVAVPAGSVGSDCTHISLWDAETSGTFLWGTAITGNPSPLGSGEGYEFAAGALVINQPVDTGGTEAMARRAVMGRVAGGVWVQYHSGAPGSAGTSNVITLARTQIPESGFTIT